MGVPTWLPSHHEVWSSDPSVGWSWNACVDSVMSSPAPSPRKAASALLLGAVSPGLQSPWCPGCVPFATASQGRCWSKAAGWTPRRSPASCCAPSTRLAGRSFAESILEQLSWRATFAWATPPSAKGERPCRAQLGGEAGSQIIPIFPLASSSLSLWSAFWTVFVADQFHLICLLISAIVIPRRHAVLFIFISFTCFCLSYSGGLSSASGFAFRLACLSSCRCFECEIKRRWIPVKKKISFYEEKIGVCVNIPLTAPNELF